MTRMNHRFASMQKENIPVVSFDVKFLSSRFPDYRLGSDNQIINMNDDSSNLLSLKEAVARETSQLLETRKRLSVRELASRFEKGLEAASKLSNEAKIKDATSLERHVLLKKVRDALESLRGHVTGRNKDDVDEAITMVEALAAQLAQREGMLIQEKEEVKMLANILKQASEDAKKLVEEERAIARSEIENARLSVQRVESALEEHEQASRASGKQQDYEELMKEVQEARRIKMLHQPSKVMDMEHELRALRVQLQEKSKLSLLLQKQLAMLQDKDKASCLYEIEGQEQLGFHLRIQKQTVEAVNLSETSIQWYRVTSDSSKRELISGATKSVYAPEPLDVGRIIQAEITSNGQMCTVSSAGPIDPAPGLGSYVEALHRRDDTEFNVVVTQMNGEDQPSESIHVLHIGKMHMKLCKGKTTVTIESYSTFMQLCGVRGGGNAASQAVFWQVNPGLSFILAFESARDRNAAIMLVRRFAFDCNIILVGPDDRGSSAGN
ncbi:hypothetical protein V2J09_000942 [Rumex salicifolius]